ncbi:MAG TPA: DUF2851 family protein [Chitinophagales bacterium]|nr:DUF2851 family protein [Chitinophagales bacterium]
MSEELLYYIWQHRLFDNDGLLTTSGESVTVVHPGIRNPDSGPDFTQAKVRINDDLLAGNIEIHVKTSDWNRHKHQLDRSYSNVILHVVFHDDVKKSLPAAFPTLELKDKMNPQVLSRYRQLMNSSSWIPCEPQIGQVSSLYVTSGLQRILVERLEQKTKEVLELYHQNKNSWEATLYQITARNFGLKANADVFERLARTLPLSIIAKHKNSLLQIESLVFGQAGMLERAFREDYPNLLKKEYQFLRKKYSLQPLQVHLWKFMRLRPPSFPTVRLAQFSRLLYNSTHLFSKMLEAVNAKQIAGLFQSEPSDYWLNHYRFDVASVKREKKPGEDFIHTLIINAVVPVMFIYGKSKGDRVLQEKALALLEQLPCEKNSVIAKWQSIGIRPRSAFDSQALLQLKKKYCSEKKCLHCFIGNKLLRGT